MRYTSEDEVCITTVMVKGNGHPAQAELQHQLLARAVMSAGTGLQPRYRYRRQPPRWPYLALSVLLLAGAVFFLYLAMK